MKQENPITVRLWECNRSTVDELADTIRTSEDEAKNKNAAINVLIARGSGKYQDGQIEEMISGFMRRRAK